MKTVKFVLLSIVKGFLLIVYVPVFILNLLVTYLGALLSYLLGIVGILIVAAGVLGLVLGKVEWSQIWYFLVGAAVFGILPCILVAFGSGILTSMQNSIVKFVFGKSIKEREVLSEAISYVPEEKEIPRSGESVSSE